MSTKLRILLAAVATTVFVDQLSKYWVEQHLRKGARLAVVEGFFYLTHERNPGGAFGALANADESFRLAVFVAISLVALAAVVVFFRRLAPGDRLQALGLGLILGGASGNFIDRILPERGEVIDLLHFRLWGGYTWPDFNCADVSIVLGLAALAVDLLSKESELRV